MLRSVRLSGQEATGRRTILCKMHAPLQRCNGFSRGKLTTIGTQVLLIRRTGLQEDSLQWVNVSL